MIRNLLPGGKPHPLVLRRVLQERTQPRHPAWAADQAGVQPDREHLGCAGVALTVELVEGADQVRGKEGGGDPGLGGAVFVVVCVEADRQRDQSVGGR